MSITDKIADILEEYGTLEAYHKALDEAHEEYLKTSPIKKDEEDIKNYLLGRIEHWNEKMLELYSEDKPWEGLYSTESEAYVCYCAKYNEVVTALLFMGYKLEGKYLKTAP